MSNQESYEQWKEANQIPNNGNGKKSKRDKPMMVSVGEQIKTGASKEALAVLKAIDNTMKGNTEIERTKFTIAHGLQDDEKVPHFTEYRDFDEVLRMNKIEMWAKIAPLVYGDTETTRKVLDIFKHHIDSHKRNMRSYKRQGEKAIVDILRADTGNVPEASFMKKFTGVSK